MAKKRRKKWFWREKGEGKKGDERDASSHEEKKSG